MSSAPPELGLGSLTDADLDPAFARAAALDDDAAWREVVTELAPGVFTLRILNRAWCDRLMADVDAVEAWYEARGVTPERPNSMNEYGLILDRAEHRAALFELMKRLTPLTTRRYPDLGGASLDELHAFVVDYARGRDEELGFHVDDSEVTLNLCLGEAFEGSELYFRGVRCERHRQTGCMEEEAADLVHEPGVAVLHAGPTRHGVEPLRRGRRRNLIVWMRSSGFRAAPRRHGCPPWCDAL